MKQVLTIVCKLNPTPEQVVKIEATLKAFADACNYVNQTVKPTITSASSIQNLVYPEVRSIYGLSANLAVRACARVGANRKTAKLKGKPVKSFKPTSVDYDARIFDFREKDWTASLTLVDGREHIKLVVSNYQRGKLVGRKPTSAQLCKHRDGQYYIHIQVKDEAPQPIKSDNVIGVDFGRREIAHTSSGDQWDGKQIQRVRDKYNRVRASLAKKATKGTRSTRPAARRLLKRLQGRERRFQMWLNHNISKRIVQSAIATKSVVAIENLTGIRDRTNAKPRNKVERFRSNSWAFYQLRQFLEYKGLQFGVEIIAVPPAWSSQTCHKCLHIGLRSEKSFKCTNDSCLWHGDSNWIAANVLSLIGAVAVNPLRGSVLSCERIRATESPAILSLG
ncbi:RNA-guided endonuclease InsQ/TnpB family protein [Gloeocapsopsis dulcis]|uniref:Transposase n=1 Tax=Gloeocapsopsis dulcis AAB1 = 1H9 TaxID=1433147 RepID=A0A6N8FZF6_9CHRO|nr:RNA-guided endonuclease TnpB family protein [Gloeocapsopsis dulcis]MUL38540.1 transposase [Gloeocapsopsis dulcis AAB1 = 1H9]WNN90670.1 transposase [Gloeocapsopsis dulcis]